jgi:hypothetical protein
MNAIIDFAKLLGEMVAFGMVAGAIVIIAAVFVTGIVGFP